MSNWQLQQLPWGQRFLDTARVIVRVPVIVVLFAASISVGAVVVALVVKGTIYVFQHYILRPW
jgi:hypothetical protein